MSGTDLKRRRQRRRPVTVLVDVQGAGEAAVSVTALISDLSIAGAKFLTNATFKVADAVALRIRLDNVDQASPTIDAAGTVVRVETLDRSRVGLWSHAVAVQFANELTDHQTTIEKLAAFVRTTSRLQE